MAGLGKDAFGPNARKGRGGGALELVIGLLTFGREPKAPRLRGFVVIRLEARSGGSGGKRADLASGHVPGCPKDAHEDLLGGLVSTRARDLLFHPRELPR